MLINLDLLIKTGKKSYDKSGKSTVTQVEFLLDTSNDSIVISCYDLSEKITNELICTDNLSVKAYAKEYANLLINLLKN